VAPPLLLITGGMGVLSINLTTSRKSHEKLLNISQSSSNLDNNSEFSDRKFKYSGRIQYYIGG
jgi:hypothetical protein